MLKIIFSLMFIGVLSSVLFYFLVTKLSDYSNRFTDWFFESEKHAEIVGVALIGFIIIVMSIAGYFVF